MLHKQKNMHYKEIKINHFKVPANMHPIIQTACELGASVTRRITPSRGLQCEEPIWGPPTRVQVPQSTP